MVAATGISVSHGWIFVIILRTSERVNFIGHRWISSLNILYPVIKPPADNCHAESYSEAQNRMTDVGHDNSEIRNKKKKKHKKEFFIHLSRSVFRTLKVNMALISNFILCVRNLMFTQLPVFKWEKKQTVQVSDLISQLVEA